MNRSQSQQGFHGLTVAAFESRMAQEMTNLIARHGGTPLVAPSMQEVPLEHNTQAIEFGEHLMTGAIDMLILLTGVGTRALLEVWATRFSRESIIQALSRIVLVVRGPKPLGVLKELGISPQVCVPEPNTWHDVLTSLDAFRPQGLHGVRIGVQEYGAPNPELITGLHDRGAQVFTVPVYRWALPNDIVPLRHVLDTILRQEVDVVLFTNAVQVDHVLGLLTPEEQQTFRHALSRMIVASIGTITTERLRHYRLPVDFEPSHAKLGIFVKEVSEQARLLLQHKRTLH